jgi:nucleoside-diphosphate-sugar epimerase
MSKVKILITGGSGFIGTNLISALCQNDAFDLQNLDINKPIIYEHLKFWQYQNLLELNSLQEKIVNFNPHFIIHLAARTDIYGKSIDDYSTNITGVDNLIHVILKLDSIKLVVFTSSMLVNKPGCENNIDFNPYDNAYAKSKVLGENIITNKLTNSNIKFTIVRPTSIWGPYFKEPYKDFFIKVLNKQFFHIGQINCYKTYGYVENVVKQYISIIQLPIELVNQKVFYLGDEEPYVIRVWANEIANELGFKIKTLPLLLFKVAALIGDLLSIMHIKFPITSYRLNNLTTNNLIQINPIINNFNKTSRLEGVRATLNFLNKI